MSYIRCICVRGSENVKYLRLVHLGATVHLPLIQVITLVPSKTYPGSQAYLTESPVSSPWPLLT